MITTIRITNIEEAKTAMAMISAYLTALGSDVVVEEVAEKPASKTVTKAKTATRAKKVSEPVKEEKAVKTAPVTKKEDLVDLSLAVITAKAKEVRGSTSTTEVKAVIAKYTTGKLSTIKEDDYTAFVADLEALVA